jgi:hypothetical protein
MAWVAFEGDHLLGDELAGALTQRRDLWGDVKVHALIGIAEIVLRCPPRDWLSSARQQRLHTADSLRP